jgi:periplasmic mercuric ion binding protein
MNTLAVSIVTAAIGAAALCPCGSSVVDARQGASAGTAQAVDTATVRLHISGMTCGTCPVTARVALTKLAGVYSATVTLADSLGVVRFDPRKTKPTEIAAHLTRMTGYGAKVLTDSSKTPRGGQS